MEMLASLVSAPACNQKFQPIWGQTQSQPKNSIFEQRSGALLTPCPQKNLASHLNGKVSLNDCQSSSINMPSPMYMPCLNRESPMHAQQTFSRPRNLLVNQSRSPQKYGNMFEEKKPQLSQEKIMQEFRVNTEKCSSLQPAQQQSAFKQFQPDQLPSHDFLRITPLVKSRVTPAAQGPTSMRQLQFHPQRPFAQMPSHMRDSQGGFTPRGQYVPQPLPPLSDNSQFNVGASSRPPQHPYQICTPLASYKLPPQKADPTVIDCNEKISQA